MYVHLGEGMIVDSSEMIAVLDFDAVQKSEVNRLLFSDCQESGNWIKVGEQPFKSVILTDTKWYFSPFSSGGRKKRAGLSPSAMNLYKCHGLEIQGHYVSDDTKLGGV